MPIVYHEDLLGQYNLQILTFSILILSPIDVRVSSIAPSESSIANWDLKKTGLIWKGLMR